MSNFLEKKKMLQLKNLPLMAIATNTFPLRIFQQIVNKFDNW